nr:MAG TPA: hypothetical protein [Caudoviricetes sp.]
MVGVLVLSTFSPTKNNFVRGLRLLESSGRTPTKLLTHTQREPQRNRKD